MAKRQKHEEHENHERWLVSYADFITLLFAFFTVMYALSQSDKAKYKQAAENIQRSFLSAGGIFPLRGNPFSPFTKTPDKGSMSPPGPQDSGQFSKQDDQAMEKIREKVQGIFEKSTGLSTTHGDIEVYRTEQGFKIRLSETVLYKQGSEKLKRESIPFLYEIGKKLSRLGMQVQVEGHTDNREPASGQTAWQLSLNRSYNVVRFLVEGADFPKNKISVAGFGDTMPLAKNDSPEGRAKNRRVEIGVITGHQSLSNLPW